MVLMNLDRLKQELPDLDQYVVFFSDGSVFQTSFKAPYNIPKIGETLINVRNSYRELFDLMQVQNQIIKRQIIETPKFLIIIIKIDDLSFIALIFPNDVDLDKNIIRIQKCLQLIESMKANQQKTEDLSNSA
jgi:predicted regulator of Ras-like GTPase activity (Roadblock/LC7/MglB family)